MVHSLFGCNRPVTVVASYVTPSSHVLKKYEQELGHSVIQALNYYIFSLRIDFEVIWTGDLNMCTANETGWSGAMGEFTDVPLRRGCEARSA